MKKIIGLLMFMFLVGCGDDSVERPVFGSDKAVIDSVDSAELTCSATSSTTMKCDNGQIVPLPATFPYSPDCNNCLVKVTSGIATVNCPNGVHFSFPMPKDGVDGKNGVDGKSITGATGATGAAGTNGSSCSVSQNKDGDTIASCTDGSIQTIKKSECDTCFNFGSHGNLYTLPTNTTKLPDFSTLTPEESVKVDTYDIYNRAASAGYPGLPARQTYFGIQFTGYILIPVCKDSVCSYRLTSDDGAILNIDSQEIVNHDGLHSPSSAVGSIYAAQGWHPYFLQYFQGPASQMALGLEVSTDGGSNYTQVPTESLKYEVQ